jgi:outer membrane protein assembly factor BamB
VYALHADTGAVRWARPIDSVYALAAGRNEIYVTGIFDHRVYSLNATTGVIQWLYLTTGHSNAAADYWALPTLSADGRMIYITSSGGYTYAIDTATGHLRWQQQTANNTYSAPVVHRGIVYVGGPDLYVYALDAANGDHRWRFGKGSQANGVPDQPLLSIIRGKLFAGGSQHLYALDPESGKALGAYPPAVPCSNGVAYTGSMDGFLQAKDIVGARVLWTRRLLRASQFDNLEWSPVTIDGNVLYFALASTGPPDSRNFAGRIIALDAATGRSRWSYAVPDTLFTAPVAAAGMVYVASGYNLYALNAATGQLQWIRSSRSQGFGQPVVNLP